jgi:hypothetical protein
MAINGKGVSVGYVKTKNGYDAELWHPKALGGTLLGDPVHMHFAQALAINGSGHSAGYACTDFISSCLAGVAVLWGPGGKAMQLQDVGGAGFSEALAINDGNYTVGWSNTATGKDAVRWSPTGTGTVLQGLKNSTVSAAVAENNDGLRPKKRTRLALSTSSKTDVRTPISRYDWLLGHVRALLVTPYTFVDALIAVGQCSANN